MASNVLDKGLQNLVQRLDQVSKGSGIETRRALEDLGLTIEDLAGLPVREQLDVIADRIAGIEDPAKQTAIAIALFGGRQAALTNLLREGSEGVKELTDRYGDLAGNISEVEAANIQAANDAIEDLKTAFGSLFQVLAVELAPTIIKIANGIADFVKGARETEGIGVIINLVSTYVQGLATQFKFLQGGVTFAIGFIIQQTAKWAEALEKVLNFLGGDFNFASDLRAIGDGVLEEGKRISREAAKQFSEIEFNPFREAERIAPQQRNDGIDAEAAAAQAAAEQEAARQAAQEAQRKQEEAAAAFAAAEQKLFEANATELESQIKGIADEYQVLIDRLIAVADAADTAAERERALLQAESLLNQGREEQRAAIQADADARAEAAQAAAKKQAEAQQKQFADVQAAIDAASAQVQKQSVVDSVERQVSEVIAQANAQIAQLNAQRGNATEEQAATIDALIGNINAQSTAAAQRIRDEATAAAQAARDQLQSQIATIQGNITQGTQRLNIAQTLNAAQTRGSFSAATVAAQATAAFRDPQVTELQTANTNLEAMRQELEDLNAKEGTLT